MLLPWLKLLDTPPCGPACDGQVDFIDLDGPTMLAVPNHPKQDKYEFGTLTEFAYKVSVCLSSP